PASLRHRRRAAMSRCDSSPAAPWWPASNDKNGNDESGSAMARILIAEDEETVRALVARALTMDGHEVTAMPDGAAALDALTGAGGAFDLLLTDIQMPMMDGIALALAAARDYPALTILLMTGYAH